MKTIRFRLTLGYMSLFLLLILAMAIGVNIAIWQNGIDFAGKIPHNPAEFSVWIQSHQGDISQLIGTFRTYTAVGVLAVIVLGSAGIYFLSGLMLRPIDKVSSLAGRISYSKVKERLNYKGPNDELKRLADTFDNMLSRLDSSIESQKQFVQDASHELRTPIAIAITNIEVLEMNDRATTEDYRKLLKILKLSLDRMHNISNGLLVLSEDTPSVASWSVIDVNALISEVVNEVQTGAERNGVNLKWNTPAHKLTVRGDVFHIKQALINLVNNGIKYNQPGGDVCLSTHTDGNFIIIDVADTGIGIAADDLSRIFTRFFRVDKSRSRERGGSGLGLSIVKKIIEDHGGTVSVDSILGKGSTFHVALPLFDLNQ